MLLEAGSPVSRPDLDILSSSASEMTKIFSKKTYEIKNRGQDGFAVLTSWAQHSKSAEARAGLFCTSMEDIPGTLT